MSRTESSSSGRRRAFAAGVVDTQPILPGVVPFGMIYGTTAVAAGISPLLAQMMSLTVFAGASQVAAVDLLARDAAWFTVLLAVLVINSRFVMYSASLAQVMPRPRAPAGLAVAYLLTDQAYAVTYVRSGRGENPDLLLPYYLGAGLALWATWQAATALGIVLGSVVPAAWELDFSIPLMFLAMLVPVLKDRPSLLAAVVSGAVMLLGRGLPHNLGLMVAVAAGIAAGLVAERRASVAGNAP